MVDRDAVQPVVLAGGESRRFGDGDKALAELDGRPLLGHVLDAVRTGTGTVPMLAVASEGDGEHLLGRTGPAGDVTVVIDDPALEGPLAGLLAAARRSNVPWLLTCGCDMPLVAPSAVGALVDRATDDIEAVVPVVDGHEQPLLALYDRERVRARASDLAGRGPRALLEELEPVERVDATAVDAPLRRAVTNVNRRAELEALRERTGRFD